MSTEWIGLIVNDTPAGTEEYRVNVPGAMWCLIDKEAFDFMADLNRKRGHEPYHRYDKDSKIVPLSPAEIAGTP